MAKLLIPLYWWPPKLLLFLSWWLVPMIQIWLLILAQWHVSKQITTLMKITPLVTSPIQLKSTQQQLAGMTPSAVLEHMTLILDTLAPDQQQALQLQVSNIEQTLTLQAVGGSALLTAVVGSLTILPGWPPKQLLLKSHHGQVEVNLMLGQQQANDVTYDVIGIPSENQLQKAISGQNWEALITTLMPNKLVTADLPEPSLSNVSAPNLNYLGYITVDGQEPCGLIVLDAQYHVVHQGAIVKDWHVVTIEPKQMTLKHQQHQRDYVLGCTDDKSCNMRQWMP